MRFAAVLENPQRSRRASVWQRRQSALGVRVPVQTMPAVGLQIPPLVSRFVGSKLCDWPFMWVRIISVTYVHNLQRTTPAAFSRFSCVLSALCLPVVTCHRAHHPPEDEHRQLASSTIRGQQRRTFIPTARYVTLMRRSSAPRKLLSSSGYPYSLDYSRYFICMVHIYSHVLRIMFLKLYTKTTLTQALKHYNTHCTGKLYLVV